MKKPARPTAPDPDFATKVRESFAHQGAMAHLGARLVRIEPGSCEVEIPFRPEVGQQHGYFHGGVIGAIADSAGGYAAFSLAPAGSAVLTVEFKLNFAAPGDGQKLIARGTVLRAGRSLTLTRAEVYAVKDGTETLCAAMQQTVIILPARPGREN
jgi:uncharacterized protein (TIGR00369 family)